MAKMGFKFVKSEETIKVNNFKRWNKDTKQFAVETTPTYFSKDINGLYQECLGTVVDDNNQVLGALIFVNEEQTPKAE